MRRANCCACPLGGGRCLKRRQVGEKPKGEWIPVPVPASGRQEKPLSGPVGASKDGPSAPQEPRCVTANSRGRLALPGLRPSVRRALRMEGLHEEGWDPQEALPPRLRHPPPEGKEACSYSRTPNARKIETEVWEEVKVLARYRDAVLDAPEKTEGTRRRAVYNTLGVTVWAARTEEDPTSIVFSALGGEEVCRSDATSRRSFLKSK